MLGVGFGSASCCVESGNADPGSWSLEPVLVGFKRLTAAAFSGRGSRTRLILKSSFTSTSRAQTQQQNLLTGTSCGGGGVVAEPPVKLQSRTLNLLQSSVWRSSTSDVCVERRRRGRSGVRRSSHLRVRTSSDAAFPQAPPLAGPFHLRFDLHVLASFNVSFIHGLTAQTLEAERCPSVLLCVPGSRRT